MIRKAESQTGLGAAIKGMRLQHELSQAQLAEVADLHPPWISEIESGEGTLTRGILRRLANALEVQVPEFAELADSLEPKIDGGPVEDQMRTAATPFGIERQRRPSLTGRASRAMVAVRHDDVYLPERDRATRALQITRRRPEAGMPMTRRPAQTTEAARAITRKRSRDG